MSQLTQEQLAQLLAAYNSGVTTISNAGKTIAYRSLDEMERILRANGIMPNPTGATRTNRIDVTFARRGT